MNLSSDFFIRMVGAQDGFRVPVLKPKVEDSNCLMTIKISGDHQNFVDISRCEKLSSTFITRTLPHACPNILHLDISYTRADELSTIYSTCIHLKTLNIAGLSHLIPNLQGIQRLRNLEALTLRSSNIDDIRALEELYCLRSLDLGCMHLKKVGNALKEKERLEELLLDETQFTNEEAISDILDYLGQLPLLKLMNITKSDLFKELQYIQDQIPIPVYYEPKTRRELFFRALAVNNVNEAYFFISCGQDINAKIEKNDEKWLSDIWIDKCYHQKTRLQTPFFIFHPIVEEIDDIFTVFDYFPNGLHLTLFFNAFESAQMLLANNIDQEEEVYISDVLYEKTERILYEQFSYGSHNDGEGGGSGKRASAFLLTSSKSMKNMMIEGLDSSNYRSKDDPDDQLHHSLNFLNKKIYSIKDYIHYLYQKNVHRFTENLINKKVSNWKSICDRYKKRLLYLIDCYDMKKQIVDAKALRGNDSFNIITLEEMDKRKSFAINFKQASTTPDSSMLLMMDVNSRPTTSEQPQRKEDDGVAIGKISNLVHQSSADSRKGDVISAAPSPSPKKLTRGVSFANFASVSIIAEQPTDPSDTSTGVNLDNFDPNQLPILQMMKQHQEKLLQGEEMNFPGGIGDEEEESLSSKDRPNILPSKPKLFNWNQHGLVNKIIGEPKIYKTVDEEAVKKEAEDAAADALFNNWMMNALPNTSDEEGKKSPKSLTRQLTNNAANAPLVKGKKRLTKLDRELAEVESFSEMMMKKNNKRNNNEKEKQELPLEISLLGKKTFWLESKKKTIEETVMKREESEIYPPIGHKTLFHQKKTFLTNLKLRLDQKVHDNILKTLGKDGKKPTAKAGKLFS